MHLPLKEARDAWTAEFESIYVRAMLKKTQGNMTRAAELAGVSRRFLQRTLLRLGLSREDADNKTRTAPPRAPVNWHRHRKMRADYTDPVAP